MEFISRFKTQDSIFGIAEVQGLHGNCNLTVGYYLSDTAVTILAPGKCRTCSRLEGCTREFATQILKKYNEAHGDSKTYFSL